MHVHFMYIHVDNASKIEINETEWMRADSTPFIEFRKFNFGDDDSEIEYAYEGETYGEDKSWEITDYLEKPSFIDYYHGPSEEEEESSYMISKHLRVKGESSEKLIDLEIRKRKQIIDKLNVLYTEAKTIMIKNKFLHKTYLHLIRNLPSTNSALEKFDECVIFRDSR